MPKVGITESDFNKMLAIVDRVSGLVPKKHNHELHIIKSELHEFIAKTRLINKIFQNSFNVH